jgi:vancomycin resistance protein YoaR
MTLDRAAFYRWLAPIEGQLYRPPRSAYFANGVIQAHRSGQKVDREKINRWLDEIHAYVNRPLEIPLKKLTPSVTTADLRRIREKRLASYTTRFDPVHVNRASNIRLSAKAIDHTVVGVGEVFSFNKTVGPRTVERGYKPAPEIVNGEYTEGIGGGICQTSTTLFNSVDKAGLRIIQRISHSKKVTYVPPNRDATVSWGGPDFQFQNQLNEPILLITHVQGGQLTVSVYGSANTRYNPKKIPDPPNEIPETRKVTPNQPQPLIPQEEHMQEPL